MKGLKKIALLYTFFMGVVLLVIFGLHKSLSFAQRVPDSYTDEELKVYKQIWDHMSNSVDMYKEQTFIFTVYIWALMMIAGYVLLLVIYFRELKPIMELQKFAEEIAKGNLDVPLPMKKNNSFVEFSEGFDIMREELRASKRREIEAENAKKQLVAELSHDLKTPVATIQATCEVLEMQISRKKEELEKLMAEAGSGSDDAGRAAEEVPSDGTADNMQGVLADRYAEIENLEEKVGYITKKAATIQELVQNVLHATIDDMKEVTLSIDEYPSTDIEGFITNLKEYGKIIMENHIPGCLVYMDRLRMEQVIDNVIGNSYKYAGTDIHVSFKETEITASDDGKKDRFVKITIRDNGPGVSEEEIPLLVEKYYRGTNSKDKNGYGLGMYLVNLYMEKQGGGFEYYNDEGFVVELLVKKV
ncbi:MAG: HAMP domain-containing histidine kinase [Lachnospiraceae bacterium]|nr:HAMP domain-containing histidine kinase [Lachnospiraceae bacterium]